MGRFTLVELMISVAIVSILAGIAIPNLRSMQLDAQRTELYGIVEGIRDANTAYIIDHDVVPDIHQANAVLGGSSYWPASMGRSQALPWLLPSGFDELGFRPDGEVRGMYTSWPAPSLPQYAGAAFLVEGNTDLDHDYVPAIAMATDRVPVELITPTDRY